MSLDPLSLFSFWKTSGDVDLLFGLDGSCYNCLNDVTIFEHNTSSGFYESLSSNEHVNDLLNDEAMTQNYDMLCTTQLDLTEELLFVEITGPLNKTFTAGKGTPLNEVGNLAQYMDEQYGVVSWNNEIRTVYDSTYIVSKNMSVIAGKWVNVSAGKPINESERMVVGEMLFQVAYLLRFSLDDYIVLDGKNVILNESSMIERDVNLRLCHSVNVSGVLNGFFHIEHGTMLGQTEQLSEFFSNSHVIYNASNTSEMMNDMTNVLNIIDIVITNSSKQVIIISFDETTNASPDDIKDAIRNIFDIPDDEHMWIEVTPQDDGSFIVSVIQTNTETIDVGDLLTKCMNHKP